jgi:hypothetical protein
MIFKDDFQIECTQQNLRGCLLLLVFVLLVMLMLLLMVVLLLVLLIVLETHIFTIALPLTVVSFPILLILISSVVTSSSALLISLISIILTALEEVGLLGLEYSLVCIHEISNFI